ncbi:MAG: orotate phosphoribosyltransferase [Candidatus Hydrogenedentota bacterium]
MTLTPEETIDAFKEAGALLEGHFIYTSGRHGERFLQAARVLQFPNIVERLCKAMAESAKDLNVDLVVGPATGGIILAYETARHLNCRGVFTEKDDVEGMALKRGFPLKPGTRILVVEDIVTTGGSVKKTIAHLEKRGATVVGVSVLIDRSSGEAQFDCPFTPLSTLELRSWSPDDCDLCNQGAPLIEPDDIVIS